MLCNVSDILMEQSIDNIQQNMNNIEITLHDKKILQMLKTFKNEISFTNHVL